MKGIEELKRNYEKYLIKSALKGSKGDLRKAAKILKISSSKLKIKVREYNIDSEEGE